MIPQNVAIRFRKRGKGSVNREITINIWVDLYFLERKS